MDGMYICTLFFFLEVVFPILSCTYFYRTSTWLIPKMAMVEIQTSFSTAYFQGSRVPGNARVCVERGRSLIFLMVSILGSSGSLTNSTLWRPPPCWEAQTTTWQAMNMTSSLIIMDWCRKIFPPSSQFANVPMITCIKNLPLVDP